MMVSESVRDRKTHPIVLAIDAGCVYIALSDDLDGNVARQFWGENEDFLFYEKRSTAARAAMVTLVLHTSCLGQVITAYREIAPASAGVLRDPQAGEKLAAEQAELAEKLGAGDQIGALCKLADVAFGAAKAVIHKTLPALKAQAAIADAAKACDVADELVVPILRAKYATRRTGGIKDDDGERAAVAAVVGA